MLVIYFRIGRSPRGVGKDHLVVSNNLSVSNCADFST